jgi:hypothetical protein
MVVVTLAVADHRLTLASQVMLAARVAAAPIVAQRWKVQQGKVMQVVLAVTGYHSMAAEVAELAAPGLG